MNFDDLKEKILSIYFRIAERVQETPAYNQAKDRFDTLPPRGQKGVILAGVLTCFAILLLIPWSWYGESQEVVTVFEERRALIRELLRVARESADVPVIPVPPPLDTMKTDIETRLKEASLLEEQIRSVEMTGQGSKLIPADKAAGSLTINLSKLNLRQLVEIGSQLTRLSPSVKLTDLEVTPSRDDGQYMDVVFRLSALSVPDLSSPAEAEPPARPGRGNDAGSTEQ